MTIAQFNALAERHHDDETMKDFRSAQICYILAEINRDRKKRSKPYKPQDFMPQKKKKTMTEEQMRRQLESINIVLGGKVN